MFTNENLLRYNKSFNEIHNIDVLLGLAYTRESSDALSGSGKGAPSDDLYYVTTDFQDIIDINGQEERFPCSFNTFYVATAARVM